MLAATKEIIASDSRLKWILLGGLILQIVTGITAIGTSSADQHFQIIEFSMHQLGKPSGAGYTWEMQHFVRQTLQVYIFSGYHLLCNGIGITDPYAQLTILRVLLGMGMFVVFNLLAIYYFRNQSRQLLFYVLLLMNFSWSLPYMRTLFSSEMVSSVFFFGTLLLYDAKKDKYKGLLFSVLIGLLFCMAFYFRFQTMFAIAGFGIWLLFFEKRYRDIAPIVIGFLIGVAINSWLDYGFYKEWVFTPYAYFHVNINEGRAAQFGTSSFMRYIWLILFVMPAPLFSLILFVYSIKAFFTRYSNPVFLSVVIFVIAHCLVGHKEERFLFPVFNALPLIAGWAIIDLQRFRERSRKGVKYLLNGLLVFTVVLNIILLTAITLVPYSQTIQFSHLLKKRFDGVPVNLYCLGQTPFETPNGSPMMFYKLGAPNINLVKISGTDTLQYLNGPEVYLSAAYNDIKSHKDEIRNAGFRPVIHSSGLLWKINEFLDAKHKTTINEIWVLYKKGS